MKGVGPFRFILFKAVDAIDEHCAKQMLFRVITKRIQDGPAQKRSAPAVIAIQVPLAFGGAQKFVAQIADQILGGNSIQ